MSEDEDSGEDAASRPSRAGRRAGAGRGLMAVTLAGVALRLWQYLADTSLWLDEIALAQGVLDRGLRELLASPLPYNQVAPKGFLLVEKLAVMALGPSDYALRLFPLTCSLIALLAFKRLASRLLDGVAPLAAVTLFATAAPLIASGALVKQYSADVCVAVLMWSLAHGLTSRPATPGRLGLAALAGSLLVWFSQPGILMAAALGAWLFAWPAGHEAGTLTRRKLAPVPACWAASSLAATLVAFADVSPETRDYLHRFWAAGFAPTSVAHLLSTRWPLNQLRLLFGEGLTHGGLAYPWPWFYVALTFAGLAVLWQRNRRTAALLTAPLALTLAASAVGQYPFSERLILFLVPGFLLCVAAAAEAARRLLLPLSTALGAAAAALLILPAVYPVASKPPVYLTEHMKPVLAYVRERRRPGDGVYVYYGAAPAVTFYGRTFGLELGDYAVGGCNRGDNRRYLRELDTFRGRGRVWVLLTHDVPQLREGEVILAYLDAIGTRMDSLVIDSRGVGRQFPPAAVYLYDLSDAEKLAAASADSFRLTGAVPAGLHLGCGNGPQAMVETDFR
jgi:hypothetical protein